MIVIDRNRAIQSITDNQWEFVFWLFKLYEKVFSDLFYSIKVDRFISLSMNVCKLSFYIYNNNFW